MMQHQHQRISVNIHDPNIEWGRQLRLQDISNSECIDNCRMRRDNLQHMFGVLWPKMRLHLEGHLESIRCANRYTVCYETGFLVLLYRYSRPRRLSPDMETIFGMRRSKLSAIIQTFSLALYHVSMPYLSDPSIWHQRMPYYSELIKRKTGNVIDTLWGFIDGTIRKTARPIHNQRTVYTRFKKCHGIKFQSVLVPDGYIACLYGPVPAKTHDAKLLRESNLLEQLRHTMPDDTSNGPVYSLYGDLAYPQSPYLLGGYRNVANGTDEVQFNRLMSSVRITVEWGYCEITEQWKFLDFCQAMRIFQSPVAQYYINAAFLSNLRNCMIGNKTRHYFDAQQMTLEQYIALVTENVN